MGSAADYLLWRGDLTFAERPFVLADNLVLSLLSYLDFSGVVPGIGQGSVTMREAWEKIRDSRDINAPCAADIDYTFLQKAAESRRFGDALLSDYADQIDEKAQSQFSALKISLGDGTHYLVFRGTDQTLVGWREDFNMSFQKVPAQDLAVQYLRQVMTEPGAVYRVGGHSKGGNLAVYAAVMCGPACRDRILQIYDNDGPGLSSDLISSEDYEAVKSRIVRIIPEFCVIGKLFEHDSRTVIVQSSGDGVMQHQEITWQILGNELVYAEDVAPASKMISGMIDQWMVNVTPEERRVFVKDFFKAAGAGGAKTLTDFSAKGVDGFESVLLEVIDSHKESRDVAGKMVKAGFSQLKQVNLKKALAEPSVYRGIAFALCGLLFMSLPEHAILIVSYSIMFGTLIFCVDRIVHYFRTRRQNPKNTRFYIPLYAILFIVTAELVSFGRFMSAASNLALGLVFVLYGAYCLRKAASAPPQHKWRDWLPWGEAVFSFVLGIVAWVASEQNLSLYIFVIGTFLVLKGLLEVVSTLYRAAHRFK